MATHDDFKESFKEEAWELLGSLEDKVIELEENPEDSELISAVFRVMHTIKGSAAMFGFDSISHFTHDVENIWDELREGKLKVSKGLIDHTLKARDHIMVMLNSGLEKSEEQNSISNTLIQEFQKALGRKESAPEPAAKEVKRKKKIEDDVTYRIHFKPNKNIFYSGTNPLLLINELHELGACTPIPDMSAVPALEETDSETCYASWEIILTTKVDENTIRDVFIFVEHESELMIEPVETYTELMVFAEGKRLGEILMGKHLIKASDLTTALDAQKKLGEVLVEKKLISPKEVKSALEEQKHITQIKEQKLATVQATSIRVSSDRLDDLVDLVGELVTVQASLTQTSIDMEDSNLLSLSEQLERLVSELRDNTMSIRMLPIGTTFNRFKRLVRDLSAELGKEIELLAEGAETELDKTVIEKLNDPLIHIIRNSIDHGIELPQEREMNGKPRTGTIKLIAEHSGANVLITIEDDGAGLNRKAILDKAVKQGVIAEGTELTDEQVFNLIFAPGFSTATNVTSVSGRGVGMDVVKRQIDLLRGSVSVVSKEGRFTKITLTLPLTLAIIEGLLVRVAEEAFILPLSAVQACLEFSREDQEEKSHRRIIEFRERILPYISLREVFGLKTADLTREQIVVVNFKDRQVGVVVDQVIGGHQTVIKSLGRIYRDTVGISGATILGDGSVILILDIQQLAELAEIEEKSVING